MLVRFIPFHLTFQTAWGQQEMPETVGKWRRKVLKTEK